MSKMRKILLFLCLCCSIPNIQASDNHLRKRLESAQKGDFVVTETGKMITVIAVRARTASSIVFEEISVPTHNLKARPASWAEWIKNKAPGHTSWSMSEIDLTTHQLLECYSFSRAAWLQPAHQDSLLSTLLCLPLEQVSEENRKKIGPAPKEDEVDRRQTWNPPLVVNGQKIEQVLFDAYAAEWPKDQSELSGKTVTLYFDQEGRFPLPYWVQVDASAASASMRVIDSGSSLPSFYHKLPRRVPEFLSSPRMTETGLQLSIKSPKYYKTFELFAIDITTKEKHIVPIAHHIAIAQGETIQLEIPKIELQQTLEAGHRYTWLLVPTGYSEYYTELTKPFQWSP